MPKSIHSTSDLEFRILLKEARSKAGLTQTQLAQRLGKPQSYVAKVEGGERRLDVIEYVHYCAGLRCSSTELLQRLLEVMSR